MTLTMSYTTQGSDDRWVYRLPFISRGQSLSIKRDDEDSSVFTEKLPGEGQFPPGTLPPPGGFSGGHTPATSRPSSIRSGRKHHSAGGVVSESAIGPRRWNGLGRPKVRGTSPVPDEAQ